MLCSGFTGKIGVEHSYQVVWRWVHGSSDGVPDPPTARPSRIAVDEVAVKNSAEWSSSYAAVDFDAKLVLDVASFGRDGTDPAAAFLPRLDQNHGFSATTFPVDRVGQRAEMLG